MDNIHAPLTCTLAPLSLSNLCAEYLKDQFQFRLNVHSSDANTVATTPALPPLMLPVPLTSELDRIAVTLVDAFMNRDPTPTHRQCKCLHEHWKSCHDYPEAHTWEARDQENIEEEEAVRALITAEDDNYLAYDKACRIRQLNPRRWQEGYYRTDEGHVTRSCETPRSWDLT
ncbi:hypothetical protein EI94DRAFT_1701993 [Lactarius quietus]|nr:hypothetical protein EI94DRAFT_1701993 [Lactarius quietus]